MSEREKIISIIRPIIKDRFLLYCHEAKDCINCDTDCQVSLAAKDFADALIEAGIGDVTEYKKTICDLNMDVVAYRALSKADTLEQIIEGQKSLINEYEHRAEVAERALLTACVNLIKDEEDNVNMELLARAVYTMFLRKAEKELAEEKDD